MMARNGAYSCHFKHRASKLICARTQDEGGNPCLRPDLVWNGLLAPARLAPGQGDSSLVPLNEYQLGF
jgi:hypothetical protein